MKRLTLLLIILITVLASHSQVVIEIGAGSTRTDKAALQIGFTYLKSLDSILSLKDNVLTGSHKVFTVNPKISFQTGTDDAFSGFIGNVTGLLIAYPRDTMIGGFTVPNVSGTFHTFPMSLGVEAANLFKTLNMVAEVGWVPWYQSELNRLPSVIKSTKFGIFLQGGYKIKSDGVSTGVVKGTPDESLEAVKKFLFRAHGNFAIDTRTLFRITGANVGLTANVDGWYDIMNGAVYHSIDARANLLIADGKTFSVIGKWGSGAPNFASGRQVGIVMTIGL